MYGASPGAGLACHIAGPRLRSPRPHLHRDCARPGHICTGTGAHPCPHLHRDWAHRCHICTGTGLTPATSALGLGSPLPHLHRDWAHPSHTRDGSGDHTVAAHARLDVRTAATVRRLALALHFLGRRGRSAAALLAGVRLVRVLQCAAPADALKHCRRSTGCAATRRPHGGHTAATRRPHGGHTAATRRPHGGGGPQSLA